MSDHNLEKIFAFLNEIGIPVRVETISTETFMPGLKIANGMLVVDLEKLKYPGDVLHEAGHIAVMCADLRPVLNDEMLNASPQSDANEMAAIAWSYAACKHLNIDPLYVFHGNGYKGGGTYIADNFNSGRYFGVPMLQYYGMTREGTASPASQDTASCYPNMLNWLSQAQT